MWLGFVNLIVDPSTRLLHPDTSPLGLAEKLTLISDFLVNFFREDNMAILVVVVEVFF
jgi:hypothetical protein